MAGSAIVHLIVAGAGYLLALGLTHLLPGLWLTAKARLELPLLPRLILSFAIGLSLWGMQAYVFGYLGLRWLSFILVAGYGMLAIHWRTQLWSITEELVAQLRRMDRISALLIALGVMVQVLQMVGSGLPYTGGMSFFRVHAQDGIYHLSLIASLIREFPPMEPGVEGLALVNYHYWSDLILADLARVFFLPVPALFFQYTPIVFALATAGALVVLCRWLAASQPAAVQRVFIRFSLFLLFFGADLSYLVMLALHQNWGFYVSAIDNGATQFLNMPHVFAKFVFLVALWSLLRWKQQRQRGYLFATILMGAVLFGIKVYFGLLFGVIMIGMGVPLLWESRHPGKARRDLLWYLGAGIVTVCLALLIYLPPNRAAGGLDWYPLEWPKLFLSEQNLDWRELRYRQAIAAYYGMTVKLIGYDLIAVAVTLLCIHGIRILGFLPYPKTRWFPTDVWWTWFGAAILFTFLGLTTLQRSGGFNVFNFFASSLTVLSIISAAHLTQLWMLRRRSLRVLVVVLSLLTLPRILFETGKILTSYVTHTDVVTISATEIAALQYVRTQTPKSAIIQSHPDNALDVHTPYVSFFSDRQSYLSGIKVLETHNQPYAQRQQQVHALFAESDPVMFRSRLQTLGITHLYLQGGEHLLVEPSLAGLVRVYSNADAHVYERTP